MKTLNLLKIAKLLLLISIFSCGPGYTITYGGPSDKSGLTLGIKKLGDILFLEKLDIKTAEVKDNFSIEFELRLNYYEKLDSANAEYFVVDKDENEKKYNLKELKMLLGTINEICTFYAKSAGLISNKVIINFFETELNLGVTTKSLSAIGNFKDELMVGEYEELVFEVYYDKPEDKWQPKKIKIKNSDVDFFINGDTKAYSLPEINQKLYLKGEYTIYAQLKKAIKGISIMSNEIKVSIDDIKNDELLVGNYFSGSKFASIKLFDELTLDNNAIPLFRWNKIFISGLDEYKYFIEPNIDKLFTYDELMKYLISHEEKIKVRAVYFFIGNRYVSKPVIINYKLKLSIEKLIERCKEFLKGDEGLFNNIVQAGEIEGTIFNVADIKAEFKKKMELKDVPAAKALYVKLLVWFMLWNLERGKQGIPEEVIYNDNLNFLSAYLKSETIKKLSSTKYSTPTLYLAAAIVFMDDTMVQEGLFGQDFKKRCDVEKTTYKSTLALQIKQAIKPAQSNPESGGKIELEIFEEFIGIVEKMIEDEIKDDVLKTEILRVIHQLKLMKKENQD